MNTDPTVPLAADGLLAAHRHLELDNGQPDPQAAADRIVAWHSATDWHDVKA
ncbi:MAG: hypothetical protein JWN68_197 [Nocardioides sp.]|jgi:hypothetical protein|uniref:hypothetical protein n=1 Tax=Nocardioides sp. TaxID=35761 RepID=UPI00262C5989|nr:hypothetical protein [Nocardioides sp.]MCW2832244.1 hypothetical protein [Nocardioides sp.]